MNIDYNKVWEIISSSESDYLKKIYEIIEVCEASFPNENWKELYDVSWNSMNEQFENCFKQQIKEIVDNKINGLYFGITTMQLNNGDNCFALEIGGTKKYDSNDKDFKWIFDLEWRGSYLVSDALYQIYLLANKENGLGNDIEWPFGLAIAKYGVANLIKKYESNFTYPIGIVVGFHDGDMMKITGMNET